VLVLVVGLISQTPSRTPPTEIFTALGLTSEQSASIEAGRAVAKVLPWGGPSEVYVFGAVHVDGAPETYLKAARDVSRLRGTPGYLGVGELPDHATVSDLTRLTFDADDVTSLKNCREGSCEVQLPQASIQAVRDTVNFSRPDAAEQVNALARQMIVALLGRYQQGGLRALGEYRDKEHPARVSDEFETMMTRASVLPNVIPELRRYLLEYPNAPLPNADSFFFWEKVDFGLKPTIRVNHAVIARGRTPRGHEYGIVAIKQLYATHYFHTALDVSVCIDDGATGPTPGFYLLTIKGSQQGGLTGFKGSILRKVVVDKTRNSLERALASIKRTVERSSPRS
jgi:hypothetical protein